MTNGLCQCGCGEITPVYKRTRPHLGHVAGEHWPFARNHQKTTILDDPKPYIETTAGCWEWKYAVSNNGYGRVHWKGRQNYAHAWMYEKANGPIPAGMEIDHLCRNRRCVNPDHLEPVTRSVNVRRGSHAKLNAELVREIRTAVGTLPQIAERFGISAGHVWIVRNRRQWSDVA